MKTYGLSIKYVKYGYANVKAKNITEAKRKVKNREFNYLTESDLDDPEWYYPELDTLEEEK